MTRVTFLLSLLFLGLASSATLAAGGSNDLQEDVQLRAADPEFLARARSETLVFSPIEARDLERGFLAGGAVSVVPAAAFSSDESSSDSQFFSFGGGQITGNTLGAGCIKARVYVRNNINISQFSVSIVDDNAASDMFFNLYRVESFLGGVDVLASIGSTGSSSSLQVLSDSSINNATVEQPTYSYYVAGCLQGQSLSIVSARVFYDIDLFEDGFESGDTTAWDLTVEN